MKTRLKSGFAPAILMIAAFGTMAQYAATQQRVSPPSSPVGTWKLESVGDKGPASIDIKSRRIEFRESEQWIYSAEMTGRYEGMKLSGSGTWSVSGNRLRYTAGANKGEVTMRLDSKKLALSPDPVIRLQGKEPVETEYLRMDTR